jgi:aldehyde dehydrogenase
MGTDGPILPPGVLNVVFGHGSEVGAPLARSPKIAKIAFTGETTTGRQIMQYAAESMIPMTLELGGKSPNIFFADVMERDDAFLDKAPEGFTLFAFNKGEVCTCPSRALVQELIFDKFIERAVARVAAIKVGDPARSGDPDGRAVLQGTAREDSELHRRRQEGRGELRDGRRTRLSGRGAGERLLRQAYRVRRPQ